MTICSQNYLIYFNDLAHAGAVGMLGCHAEGISADISSKMAVICGTSSCHMSVEKELIWANGIHFFLFISYPTKKKF